MSDKDTVVVTAFPPGPDAPKQAPLQEAMDRATLARRASPMDAPSKETPSKEASSDESPGTHITKGMDDRTQVEHTADRIRDELLLTLEELDRRRARAMDMRYQISSHRDMLMMAGGAALMLIGVGVGVSIWRARHRQELLAKKRRKALERVWTHPERVAATAESRPLSVELGRKLVLIFGSALASSIAKSSMQTLVPQRRVADDDESGKPRAVRRMEEQQATAH
jgi:hypothetical protein